ncbi:outer membrane efflux protein BepC [Candidatus Phycosocius bacilliformis]|uniref:Outer membrane efflux protein BepC n=1 Tax=Candidatus Phycosocius bacilliformis TaxID=1445552 RepID=A0A2P2EED5_9PROT|nr:TolC family outer membrane protein [Candidatus Phycosocius bacilliformis]GBF59419.1 outer membrane efflux protein BepC [Candidatus Phycosocius bacilliformis]
MKKIENAALFALGLVAFAAHTTPSIAQTLPEAVTLALQTNPGLEAQRASLRALGQRRVQANAQRRMTIAGEATYADQTAWTRSINSAGVISGRIESNTTPTTYGITASQPIWLAGRVKAAMSLADAQIAQADARLAASELAVMRDVVIAYADLRRDLRALEIRRQNLATLNRQLEAVRARFDVGDVTKTDVAQVEARQAASKTALAAAEAAVDASRSAIERLIGQAPTILTPEIKEVVGPGSLDQALVLARANNPDLAAIRLGETIALAGAKVIEAENRPRLTVQASQGWGENSSFDGNRSGSTAITARLSVPIFTGGLVSSRVTEALGNANAARYSAVDGERQISERTTNAWNQIKIARIAVAASAEQVKAAQIAFDGAELEQSVGLRTTLDVLIQQQELLEAQLAEARAIRDLQAATIALAAITGNLKPADLEATSATVKKPATVWPTPPEVPLMAVETALSVVPLPSVVSQKAADRAGGRPQTAPPKK